MPSGPILVKTNWHELRPGVLGFAHHEHVHPAAEPLRAQRVGASPAAAAMLYHDSRDMNGVEARTFRVLLILGILGYFASLGIQILRHG